MRASRPLTWNRAVWCGLTRRCPLCGARGIFVSWYSQRDRCPTCAFPTSRSQDQWLGGFGMNVIVSFTVLVATIAAGFAVTYPDPPVPVLLAVCGTVAVVFPLVFQPVSRSLWAGIDLAMRPPGAGDAVDPAFLPASLRSLAAELSRRDRSRLSGPVVGGLGGVTADRPDPAPVPGVGGRVVLGALEQEA